VNEALAIGRIVAEVLLPVAVDMFREAMAGNDPRQVLLDGRVANILPPQSKTEAAMLAARKVGP
jgi:hypothetical protein